MYIVYVIGLVHSSIFFFLWPHFYREHVEHTEEIKLFTTENRKNVTNRDDNRTFYQLKTDEEKKKRLYGLKTGVKDSLFHRLARPT